MKNNGDQTLVDIVTGHAVTAPESLCAASLTEMSEFPRWHNLHLMAQGESMADLSTSVPWKESWPPELKTFILGGFIIHENNECISDVTF